MSTSTPPWLDFAREDPERERLAALTPAERLTIFAELCVLSEAILKGRPDRRDILRHRDPMSPEAERQWLELVARYRDA